MPLYLATFEDLSIHASFNNVELILSKLRWSESIQYKSKYDSKLNLDLFWTGKFLKKKTATAQISILWDSCRSLYASPDDRNG